MYDDVPSVFVDTGLEYPEIKAFIKEINEGKYEPNFRANVEILRPKMRFDEVIKKYGYPVVSKQQSEYVYEFRHTKSDKLKNIRINGNQYGMGKISKKWLFLLDAPFEIGDNCCDIMKKRPVYKYEKQTDKTPIIGTRADESRQRKSVWFQYGCNAFDKKRPTSTPLSFWSESDILEYCFYYQLPLPKLYGEIKCTPHGYMCDRTSVGCMFCMFGAHLEKEPNRFQRMKETHPKQYDYCMRPVEENGLGLKGVIDWINENSGGKTKILY